MPMFYFMSFNNNHFVFHLELLKVCLLPPPVNLLLRFDGVVTPVNHLTAPDYP